MKNSNDSDITLEQLVLLINHEIAHHEKRRLLDKEQDLALNKLGDMSLPTHSRDGRLLRPKEQDLALNKLGQMRASCPVARAEGYNDGFKDGFKEGIDIGYGALRRDV